MTNIVSRNGVYYVIISEEFRGFDKGKLAAKRGRKAQDLNLISLGEKEIARLPKSQLDVRLHIQAGFFVFIF